MTTEDRNDAMLVKIIDVNEENGAEKLVASYYTTAINETLKMFITAKEYQIDIDFNQHSFVVDDEYTHTTYLVKDVCIRAGSSEDMPMIQVYI